MIITHVSKFILPFLLVFGSYIFFHGEISPGGAFQAGAIFASAFILHALVFNKGWLVSFLNSQRLLYIAALGVFIYLATGIIATIKGKNFLNYNVLLSSNISGQKLGIMLIEIGVVLTVFSVLTLIYQQLQKFIVHHDNND